jgi:hypothetical protein
MSPEIEQRHNDLQKTIDKLSNGHRGDPHTMSDAIVEIGRAMQIVLRTNFVTEEKCTASHECLIKDIKKTRFGWKHLAAVLIACATLFGLGTQIIDEICSEPAPNTVIELHQDVESGM